MIKGIPIASILAKADPIEAPKLTVVRGLQSFEDSDSNKLADLLVRRMKDAEPELEVADIYLPMYRILTNVTNDPDDKKFAPEDQFPAVYDAIRRADVLVFVTRESCGFPDSNTVRLVERLSQKCKLAKESGKVSLFDRKVSAVVVYGGCGVFNAASTLASALNKFGAITTRQGMLFWDKHRGNYEKDEQFTKRLERTATDLVKLIARE